MLIENLNSVARKYYSPNISKHDHSKYLDECFELLNAFFETKLKDNYLFSGLTYNNKRDEAEIKTVSSKTSETGYHFNIDIKTIMEPVINDLLIDIKKKDVNEMCMSLTYTLLRNPTEGTDLFLVSGDGYNNKDLKSNRPKTDIYQLSTLIFAENFKIFLTFEENQRQIDEFRRIKEAFLDFDDQKIGRLLWHYKRLENICKNQNQDLFVHFIRPSFIDFGHNILLSLATNEVINYQLLLTIDLLIYRIASHMAIEKNKEADKIENLKLVSNSIHSIKTGTNILLSPALNSLAQMDDLKDNHLIKIALAARDQLLAITEIINLISKLSSKNLTNLQKKEELTNSGLFSTRKHVINLSEKLQEIIDLNSKDRTKAKIILEGDKNIILDETFLSYEEANPTELFYLFFLITIFENCIKHGKKDVKTMTIKVKVQFDAEKKIIEFKNQSKSENDFELTFANSTGYINFLFFIFRELKFGEIKCVSKNKVFTIEIRSN